MFKREKNNGAPSLWVLDYGGGNVRSVCCALDFIGCSYAMVENALDIANAPRLIFPGVGSFTGAMSGLRNKGLLQPVKDFIESGKPFLGVCIGLQCLGTSSEESPGCDGMGLLPSPVRAFPRIPGTAIPHMGWNKVDVLCDNPLIPPTPDNEEDSRRFYFVHSFCVMASDIPHKSGWDIVCRCTYSSATFAAVVRYRNLFATQFHPEKSGASGLNIYRNFMNFVPMVFLSRSVPSLLRKNPIGDTPFTLAKRIIACLDVRASDDGRLVVTKGNQYKVRNQNQGGAVRDFGNPVDVAIRYYEQGADEITFLCITAFKELQDLPMLEVLREVSQRVFVPLTIGGGIRDTIGTDGLPRTALEVATVYFRSGADKVSIGSDAVAAAIEFCANKGMKTGKSSIEQIAHFYGTQAVVISVDPFRVYVDDPSDTPFKTIRTLIPGPSGEKYCWYQCTVKGGRENSAMGVYELANAVEQLGAGELLVNCIDKDGTNNGFDLELLQMVKDAVTIPVIASSGAGCAEHFVDACKYADAALAAGIFHRNEMTIQDVKTHLGQTGLPVRLVLSNH
eukprot:GHVT01087894.1.p1 GENE.GHVT01087894.1~~GHVT01087894.1.p1  ORF type:complete len:563 (+),score=33.59 GHVT01087894.1:1564-3252(+)